MILVASPNLARGLRTDQSSSKKRGEIKGLYFPCALAKKQLQKPENVAFGAGSQTTIQLFNPKQRENTLWCLQRTPTLLFRICVLSVVYGREWEETSATKLESSCLNWLCPFHACAHVHAHCSGTNKTPGLKSTVA